MTKEEIGVFSKRITQGSKSDLVVITYDIILHYVEAARKANENGEKEEFVFHVKKAKQFLNNLSSSLDFTYRISLDLMSIYMFVDRCFIQSIVKREDCKLESTVSILQKLRSSFEEISKEDTSGAVMKNGEEIYVGLTYGRGTLNEVAVRNREYS